MGPRSPILAAMPDDQPLLVPVWVELVTKVAMSDPPPDPDDLAATNDYDKLLTAAVAAAIPGAKIVTVLPPEQVEQVMNQHAADLQEALNETRRLLLIAIGAIEHDIATQETTLSSLRNITAMIPRPQTRTVVPQ